jgi:hypothetical protein
VHWPGQKGVSMILDVPHAMNEGNNLAFISIFIKACQNHASAIGGIMQLFDILVSDEYGLG